MREGGEEGIAPFLFSAGRATPFSPRSPQNPDFGLLAKEGAVLQSNSIKTEAELEIAIHGCVFSRLIQASFSIVRRSKVKVLLVATMPDYNIL